MTGVLLEASYRDGTRRLIWAPTNKDAANIAHTHGQPITVFPVNTPKETER